MSDLTKLKELVPSQYWRDLLDEVIETLNRQEATLKKSRAEITALKEKAEEAKWLSFHGCFTGDCPHNNSNECVESIREVIIEQLGEAIMDTGNKP